MKVHPISSKREESMVSGIIVKGIDGFYYVDSGDKVYECKARGLFRLHNKKPMIGDYVEIDINESTEQGYIIDIKERKSELIRPEVANVEQVIIVISAKKPDISMDLLQKLLVYTEYLGLKILICINKIDLDLDKEYESVLNMLNTIPYNAIKTSAVLKTGLEELRGFLSDNISVFAGPSGVGKSSLLNAISPDLRLKTGKISHKTKRGTHTTRHAELIKLKSGGMVVDTPGFSSFDVLTLEEKELQYYFPEFDEYRTCKFSSCVHDREPNCGIKEAVENGYINKVRYEYYIQMLNEIKDKRRY